MYNVNDWSYGVELEYGDSYRFCELPEGAQWNDKDNTCVSTTGIANDPDGKLYKYGGEINTKPTYSIEEQIAHIKAINETLCPAPVVNYRSNLHIHIRVPNLHNDLESCKKLLRYVDRYQQQAFDIVETIPVPDKNTLSPEVYEWAHKRMKRRQKSHQNKLPKSRVEAMLASTTTQEFFENHAHKDAKGNPAWFQCPRAGINLRQMWEETNTIEFRHFPGTTDMVEMESCIRWCREFLNAALNRDDVSPAEFYAEQTYQFPDFEPYEYETEQIYQWTNFDSNTKKDITKRLEALREHIDIDAIGTVNSKMIFPIMRQLQEQGL
jgi:hypothetical protein